MWNTNLAMDRNQEGAVCPNCEAQNIISHMKFLYISLEEMVLKCESSTCLFPFDNFKYKSVKDGSFSTYQPSPQKTTGEILRSPNKIHSIDEDKIEYTLSEFLHVASPYKTNSMDEDKIECTVPEALHPASPYKTNSMEEEKIECTLPEALQPENSYKPNSMDECTVPEALHPASPYKTNSMEEEKIECTLPKALQPENSYKPNSMDEDKIECTVPEALHPAIPYKTNSMEEEKFECTLPVALNPSSPYKTNSIDDKIECALPEALHPATDNPDPTNEILEDFDLTFFTDDHRMEVETYTQCDNSSGTKEEQLPSLPDFSVINFQEYAAFEPLKKESERIDQPNNANVFSFDNMFLDPQCTNFETERQFLMSASDNFVNIHYNQENNTKADVDKKTAIEIHSVEILPQPVNVTVTQVPTIANEIKVECQSESDTISKYLDMIKAKHKKAKTSKKKPKIKNESEGAPPNICNKISLKLNSPKRPLDILKSIGRLK